MEGLYSKHFGIEANRYIYTACIYLYGKKLEPTPVAILEVLPDKKIKGIIEEIGGLEYLVNLTETRARPNNLKIFVQKIQQASTRREIIKICEQTTREMQDDSANILNDAELVMTLEKKITELNVEPSDKNGLYKMGDETEEILAERAKTPSAIPGLEVGWPKVDKITNGGQPGDLIFVAARSKTGKSVALTNWAIKLGIIDQLPILYIDTEMDSRDVEDRILANLSGVPQSEIVSALYTLDTDEGLAIDKIAKVKAATKRMKEGKLYHLYMPGFSLEKIIAITRQFQMQHGIVALFFDYLKFPANQMATLRNVAEWQMLGFLASGLKDLAGILKIPIYSAVQENRSALEGKKTAGSIAGSDRILQLATKLMFLYDKEPEEIAKYGIECGNQWLYIAFQRNGESKCEPIPIRFYKTILRQKEV